MNHLDDITVEDLQNALGNADGKKPTQRLLAAIAYKNGVTQTELAEWNGVERKTIYNWLTRLDDASLEEAVQDAHRSGRNRKLSEDQLDKFRQTVHKSPREAGYNEPAWTTKLVQQHLAETYDAEYSLPSCRRLLKEAGLSYQKPRSSNASADSGGRERFDDDIKTSGGIWMPP